MILSAHQNSPSLSPISSAGGPLNTVIPLSSDVTSPGLATPLVSHEMLFLPFLTFVNDNASSPQLESKPM